MDGERIPREYVESINAKAGLDEAAARARARFGEVIRETAEALLEGDFTPEQVGNALAVASAEEVVTLLDEPDAQWERALRFARLTGGCFF
jgi:hypothetical protein